MHNTSTLLQTTRRSRTVAAANRWRECYNPLRGLTLSRAVQLLECYPRGEFADLQWTFHFIEQTDEDLFALLDRGSSALLEMDWGIKIISPRKRRKNFDQVLAEEQAAYLREFYEGIDNLYEAVDHFALSRFRGYAHCQKHFNHAGELVHLEILDQWNVVRDGLAGAWKYNPQADQVSFAGLPAENQLAPEEWVIRENRRYLNRIALIKFIRANLSNKDWDAFIEIYGIPGVFIIGPPNVGNEDKEKEYQASGEQAAEGGSGYLPHGSIVHTSDGPRGNNPFRDRMEFLSEKLILAGTNGMLTMLAQSGSGTLAGNAHQETFAKLAKGEARKISESCFQKQIDKAALATKFPGRPVLAYFELAANEERNVGAMVDHAQKLAGVFDLDAAEFSEKTGYKLMGKGKL